MFSLKYLANPIKSSTFAALEPAKPLNDPQMCGSFYYYTMSNRIHSPNRTPVRTIWLVCYSRAA